MINNNFVGNSADSVWLAAAKNFMSKENVYSQPSRNGTTIESLGCCFSIVNPRNRWVISRSPALNPSFALAEVVWILNGSKDAEVINHWNPILQNYAGCTAQYHGAYGYRLRSHFEIDQLDRAFNALSINKDTRQIVLQIWDSTIDLPDTDGKPQAEDIPCNICSFLKVRKNKLEWMQICRSNDLFLGVPHNFVQFTCLQEIIAGWLNVDIGSYTHLSDSLHIYQKDLPNFKSLTKIEISDYTESLCLPKDKSDAALAEIFGFMKAMSSGRLSRNDLLETLNSKYLNESYANLLCLISADSARRKGWDDISTKLMSYCSNPIYQQLWQRWIHRKKSKNI